MKVWVVSWVGMVETSIVAICATPERAALEVEGYRPAERHALEVHEWEVMGAEPVPTGETGGEGG